MARKKRQFDDIDIPPGKTGITPRDLLGPDLYDELERLLRKHFLNIGSVPRPGEYPALVFGKEPGGVVSKIKFPIEFN